MSYELWYLAKLERKEVITLKDLEKFQVTKQKIAKVGLV